MQPSKVRKFFSSGNLRRVLVMLSTFILATAVIALSGRQPASAQDDTKAVNTVRAESTEPGKLQVSWDAPTNTPRDYRISWARVGENFKTWTDESGNAFPTDPSYTITDLDEGARYKVRVRARYDEGGPGEWSEQVEAVVASAPTATSTATSTATPTTTATPTPTVTHTPTPEFTATATPTVAVPAQPQNLQAETTHSAVTLTWDDPGDSSITGYQILRRNPAIDEQRQFATVAEDTGSTATRYVDDTVSPNTRYIYRVKARNAGGTQRVVKGCQSRCPDTAAYANANRNVHGDAYCYDDANRYTHPHTRVYGHAYPNTRVYGYTHPHARVYGHAYPNTRVAVRAGAVRADDNKRRGIELDRCAGRSPLRTVGVGKQQRMAADWRELPDQHDLHAHER